MLLARKDPTPIPAAGLWQGALWKEWGAETVLQLNSAAQQGAPWRRIAYKGMQPPDPFNKPQLLSPEHTDCQGGGSRKVPQHFLPFSAQQGITEWEVTLGSTTPISQPEDEGLRKPIREAPLVSVIHIINNCPQNCFPSFAFCCSEVNIQVIASFHLHTTLGKCKLLLICKQLLKSCWLLQRLPGYHF